MCYWISCLKRFIMQIWLKFVLFFCFIFLFSFVYCFCCLFNRFVYQKNNISIIPHIQVHTHTFTQSVNKSTENILKCFKFVVVNCTTKICIKKQVVNKNCNYFIKINSNHYTVIVLLSNNNNVKIIRHTKSIIFGKEYQKFISF